MNTKFYLPVITIVCCLLTASLRAQQPREHLARLYVDNDFMNVFGNGSDKAYTSGARLDFLYTGKKKLRWLPNAGDSSRFTNGWSLMQIMITPSDIYTTRLQKNDYPFSGALFGIYTYHSYNPSRQYGFQTELLAGVMGPASLAGPTQKLMHRIINYNEPRGWSHQLSNAPLLNVTFTAEKQLAAAGDYFELIGGGSMSAGTMSNSLTLYPLLRIGNMHPYFEGPISRYTNPRTGKKGHRKGQLYFITRPQVSLNLTQALLTGGISNNSDGKIIEAQHPLQKAWVSVEYGVMASKGRLGASFTQTHQSVMLKGLYDHKWANFSVYYNW